MNKVENPDNPGQPTERESSPVQMKVGQQVGAISGGQVIGVDIGQIVVARAANGKTPLGCTPTKAPRRIR